MRRVAAVALALLSPACDRVFDLTAAPDAASFPVTGRLRVRYAVNDAAFMPVLHENAYPAGTVTMSVTLDDGSAPAVSYDDATGTFAFATSREGQPYRLHVATATYAIDHDESVPHLELLDRTVGRPDRVPVTMATNVAFQLGAAIGFPYVTSTGLWTITYVPVGNSANATLDWATAGSLGGPLGLLDASANDRLYWTELTAYPAGSATPTHYAIDAFAETAITQTDGGTTVVAGALTPRAHELCGHLVLQRAEEAARIASRDAGPFFNSGADWWIYAVPSRAALFNAGTLVLAQTSDGTTNSLDVAPTFTNPYPGTELLASSGVVFNREYRVGTALPMYANTSTREWVPLTAGASCTANLAVFQYGAALPLAPRLAGQPLDTDDQAITLGDADPEVSWERRDGEPVDLATVQVLELTTTPDGTQTTVVNVGLISLRGTHTTLPRAWFQPGKTYFVKTDNRVGYPDIAAGDRDTLSYPYILATNWSRTFTIATP